MKIVQSPLSKKELMVLSQNDWASWRIKPLISPVYKTSKQRQPHLPELICSLSTCVPQQGYPRYHPTSSLKYLVTAVVTVVSLPPVACLRWWTKHGKRKNWRSREQYWWCPWLCSQSERGNRFSGILFKREEQYHLYYCTPKTWLHVDMLKHRNSTLPLYAIPPRL